MIMTINVYSAETGEYLFNIPSHDSFYKIRVHTLIEDGFNCKVYDENYELVYTMESCKL